MKHLYQCQACGGLNPSKYIVENCCPPAQVWMCGVEECEVDQMHYDETEARACIPVNNQSKEG